MPNDQLLDYINQARKSGKNDDHIRKELLGTGWQSNDIEEALKVNTSANILNKSSKFSVLIPIVLVVALGGYFASAYFLTLWPFETGVSMPVPTITPQSSSAQKIDDWKVYRNEVVGFEFKYPKNWILESHQSDIALKYPDVDYNLEEPLPMSVIWENTNFLNIDDWYRFNYTDQSFRKDNPDLMPENQNFKIGNLDAIRYIDPTQSGSVTGQVALIKNKQLFKIAFSIEPSEIDQILSAFKFIEKSDTSKTETYLNIEYGFEFKYPGSWEIDTREINKGDFWLKEKDVQPDFGMSSILISVRTKKVGDTLENIIPKKDSILKPYYNPDKNMLLDGIQAIQVRLVKPTNPPSGIEGVEYVPGLNKETFAIKNNLVFEISGGGEDTENVEKIYDQILATFKFREPITYKNDSEGFLALKEIIDCNEKVNFDPPNTNVLYSSAQKVFSFQVPFNNNWGNHRIKLRPYEETSNYIIFGNLEGGEGCGFTRQKYLYFDPVKSADNIISDLKKDPYYQYYISKPTKLNFNGLTAVKYEGPGDMCSPQAVIVIGTRFNYRFTFDCNGDINELETVAKTAKLIN